MFKKENQNDLSTEESVQTEETKGEGRVYEVGFHLNPTLSAEKVTEAVATLKSELEKVGASIISEGAPKKISLAYPIRKKIDTQSTDYDQAFFGWVKFETLPEVAEDLDDYMSKQENVLRYIIIKTVKDNTYITPESVVEMDEKTEADSSQEMSDGPAVSKTDEKEKAGKTDEKEIDESIEELVKEE